MGRLIDADEMTKRLQEWNRNDDIDKALYNFAMHRITEQPTAFDVEAVVKELGELKKEQKLIVRPSREKKDSVDIVRTIEYVKFDDVMEIVRKGGVK